MNYYSHLRDVCDDTKSDEIYKPKKIMIYQYIKSHVQNYLEVIMFKRKKNYLEVISTKIYNHLLYMTFYVVDFYAATRLPNKYKYLTNSFSQK